MRRSWKTTSYVHKWKLVPNAVLALLVFIPSMLYYVYVRIHKMPLLAELGSEPMGWISLLLEGITWLIPLIPGFCYAFEATHDHILVDLQVSYRLP